MRTRLLFFLSCLAKRPLKIVFKSFKLVYFFFKLIDIGWWFFILCLFFFLFFYFFFFFGRFFCLGFRIFFTSHKDGLRFIVFLRGTLFCFCCFFLWPFFSHDLFNYGFFRHLVFS
ncbi:MAG: hypothetical protein EHM49_00820 [Deltaproteobacteria bacterium]|nr:MAG: hypothetical protein EHM49_06385 [Deltaproteobacteria bacterium]RPI56226.1 MAG: hypothetical protein EHM49_00820 [Deltaproteobacteria bacterium]